MAEAVGIPQAAVEAAQRALGPVLNAATEDGYARWAKWHHCDECPTKDQPCACAGITWATSEVASAALVAGGPHIAAAALRQAAEELWDRMDGSLMCQTYCAWLRFRADQLDGRQPEPDTREGILAAAGLEDDDDEVRRALLSRSWAPDWDSPQDSADDIKDIQERAGD